MILIPHEWHIVTLAFNEPFPNFSLNDTTTENVNMIKIIGIAMDIKLN